MVGSETNEIITDLFIFFLQKYQEGLEESMGGSEFVYDSVDVLYYNLNKVSLSRGGSYIDSPKWLKNKKGTTNPQNKKDDRCFQYAVTVALNYEQIKDHPERISKIKPFIDKYDWKEIDFPSQGKDWKKFESKNKSIGLNILYVPYPYFPWGGGGGGGQKCPPPCYNFYDNFRTTYPFGLKVCDFYLFSIYNIC